MVLSSDELDQMADDLYKDRRIRTSIHCGKCGYNLKTLPYAYTCPECGNSYNARPLSMKGILVPDGSESPVGTAVTVVLAGLAGAASIATGAYFVVQTTGILVVLNLIFGASMIVLGLYCVYAGERRLRRFYRHRSLWKHIAKEEGAD